jgi:hypothetical protein
MATEVTKAAKPATKDGKALYQLQGGKIGMGIKRPNGTGGLKKARSGDYIVATAEQIEKLNKRLNKGKFVLAELKDGDPKPTAKLEIP